MNMVGSEWDTPGWLRPNTSINASALEAWDRRQSAREQGAELIMHALFLEDRDTAASAADLLASLPPLPAADLESDAISIEGALAGEADAVTLAEAYCNGAIDLTSEEDDFVADRPVRLRLVALSRKLDLGRRVIEEIFTPSEGHQVLVAARAGDASAIALAEWLGNHPEITGDTSPTNGWHVSAR
jgi:hypothetical protein